MVTIENNQKKCFLKTLYLFFMYYNNNNPNSYRIIITLIFIKQIIILIPELYK